MDLREFFLKYYVEPLGKYYTLPATITYACIFLLALYLVYRLCEKLKIRFTERFIFALLPFVLLGGVIRALRDAEIIYKGVLFVSPPIYFFMFGMVFSLVLLSRALGNKMKKDENLILACFGMGLLVLHLFFVRIENFGALLTVMLLWGSLSFFAWLLLKILKLKRRLNFGKLDFLAISAQLLDACSAFTAIEFFGYGEQHVLSSWIMQTFGVWFFIPVKFLAAFLVILAIEKYGGDENLKNYLKFIIITLGFALGTRNALRAAMNV